jgi:hypothetical protein
MHRPPAHRDPHKVARRHLKLSASTIDIAHGGAIDALKNRKPVDLPQTPGPHRLQALLGSAARPAQRLAANLSAHATNLVEHRAEHGLYLAETGLRAASGAAAMLVIGGLLDGGLHAVNEAMAAMQIDYTPLKLIPGLEIIDKGLRYGGYSWAMEIGGDKLLDTVKSQMKKHVGKQIRRLRRTDDLQQALFPIRHHPDSAQEHEEVDPVLHGHQHGHATGFLVQNYRILKEGDFKSPAVSLMKHFKGEVFHAAIAGTAAGLGTWALDKMGLLAQVGIRNISGDGIIRAAYAGAGVEVFVADVLLDVWGHKFAHNAMHTVDKQFHRVTRAIMEKPTRQLSAAEWEQRRNAMKDVRLETPKPGNDVEMLRVMPTPSGGGAKPRIEPRLFMPVRKQPHVHKVAI